MRTITKRLSQIGYDPQAESNPEQLDLPAIADWHLADLYCQSIGARLPTEAEWEKAARGVDGRLDPWGNDWDPTRCHCREEALSGRTPMSLQLGKRAHVNAYPGGVSPYGVWDMAGDVYEWTTAIVIYEDGREALVLKSHAAGHMQVPWFENIVALRWRGGYKIDDHWEHTGFRPVRDAWAQPYWTGWR
jgi:formylglycine-generating enzyme required for sulfatase activity